MEPRAVTLYREVLRLLDAAGNLPHSGEYNLIPLIIVRDEIEKLLKEYELSKSKYKGWSDEGAGRWRHVESGATLRPSGDIPGGFVLSYKGLAHCVWYSPNIGESCAIAGANEIIRKVR